LQIEADDEQFPLHFMAPYMAHDQTGMRKGGLGWGFMSDEQLEAKLDSRNITAK